MNGKYLNLVCDYMPTSLSRFNIASRENLLEFKDELEYPEMFNKRITVIKKLCYQFFKGLAFLHS